MGLLGRGVDGSTDHLCGLLSFFWVVVGLCGVVVVVWVLCESC